jgi:hypothetical protein
VDTIGETKKEYEILKEKSLVKDHLEDQEEDEEKHQDIFEENRL